MHKALLFLIAAGSLTAQLPTSWESPVRRTG